ncbi:MAG: hypothetical protein ABI395_12500 [Sphingobium sp.]
MHNEYSKTGSEIIPFRLNDDMLLAMGRLIRSFAELEDIISLHLCNLASISEGQSLVLLGITGISKKLALATTFANALGGSAKQVTSECFENEAWRGMLRCRNVVAHGFLLGMTEQGKVAFRTTALTGADESTVGVEVATYAPGDFKEFADIADLATRQIEHELKVTSLRAERRAQRLVGHPKAQPTRAPSEVHLRQPKPPRVKAKDKPVKNGRTPSPKD